MVDLQIEQKFGRIGLNIQPSEYNLKIQPAQFDIKQVPAQISLEQPAAILDIDNTPVREALGYRGIESQTKYCNSLAEADYEAGLERRVREGNELGEIEKKISIAQITAGATEPKEKSVTIEALPPIKIHFTVRPPEWHVELGGVETDYQPGDVSAEVTASPKISGYWEQKPYIRITAVNWIVDANRGNGVLAVGGNVNKTA